MRGLDFIATAAAVGIFGYFVYKVILPKLGDLQLPVWQPPAQPQQQQAPVQYQQPAATTTPDQVPPAQPIEQDPEKPKQEQEDKPKSQASLVPSRSPPSAVASSSGAGGTAEGGAKLVYKTTGRKVALPTKASPHENGDRYSSNHKFINYIIFAYLKGSHQAQGCKTDGPNHGGCQSMKPTCFWIDPDLQMSNGSIKYGAEYPHPKANPVSCASCKSAGVSLANKWYGYQGIAYQGSGGPSDRWNEVWVDVGAGANGEPGNKWVNLLKENYTKNIPADWRRPNGLPVDCSNCGSGTGLEGEIRMRGANGTSIKYGAIIEIVNPLSGGTAAVRKLMIDEPYLFNGYYGRRRL